MFLFSLRYEMKVQPTTIKSTTANPSIILLVIRASSFSTRIYNIKSIESVNSLYNWLAKNRLPNEQIILNALNTPETLNQSWSVDFMYDALVCGRRFRTFNVVDDFSREALSIEIDLNLPALRVVRVFDRLTANRGYPVMLRMNNGPEFLSLALAEWAERHTVKLEFIQPGKPTQNAFIERFNRTYSTEILDFYLFRTLNEVRETTDKWLSEYNCERPHESLNNITPEEYRQHHQFGQDLKKSLELKRVYLQFAPPQLYILYFYPLYHTDCTMDVFPKVAKSMIVVSRERLSLSMFPEFLIKYH